MILENATDVRNYRLGLKSEPTIVPNQKPIDMNQTEPAIPTAISIRNFGMIKRFIPYYMYKPPFGYPRRDIDVINCRRLAKSPFVFSVIKTLLDEICSADWDIIPNPDSDKDEDQLKEKIRNIKAFFTNPNGNDESFRTILRGLVRDILELDAGVLEKVYNRKGELTQLYNIDGSTVLKNPDEHGYMGNRLDYINIETYSELASLGDTDVINSYYRTNYKETAAYFQYNWNGGVYPIPFGKKEIVYIKANDSADSIYGTSPVQVLYNIILTLIYGAQLNLDMYANNNLPTGILTLMNANKQQMEATRDYFNQHTQASDVYGNRVKQWFNVPIVPDKAEYIDFKLNAKDMQMLEQQKWFQDIVYKTFGVTPSQMGEVESSNRSTENEQSKIFKRKALAPIFKLLEYHFDTQIVWELDPDKDVIFKFNDYDIEAEFRKAELNEKLINSTWTVNEVREKDNMKPLDGAEFDTLKAQDTGYSYDSFNMDSLNHEGHEQDLEIDSRDEPDLPDMPTTKTVESDVPKISDSEKGLVSSIKDFEKELIGLL